MTATGSIAITKTSMCVHARNTICLMTLFWITSVDRNSFGLGGGGETPPNFHWGSTASTASMNSEVSRVPWALLWQSAHMPTVLIVARVHAYRLLLVHAYNDTPKHVYIHMYIYTQACIYTHTCLGAHVYIYVHVYTHAYVFVSHPPRRLIWLQITTIVQLAHCRLP